MSIQTDDYKIDEAAICAVIDAINAIGQVEYTAVCRAKISAARDLYSTLNAREKTLVGNYNSLVSAENAFRDFEQEHEKAVVLIADGAADILLDPHEDRVYYGSYVQQSGGSAEPVLWRVLDNANGNMLLLSDKSLAYKAYHISDAAFVTWSACSLRAWLNESNEGVSGEANDHFFTDAFSLAEQRAISYTDCSRLGQSGGQSQTGSDSLDKVFILSGEEVMNPAYGFDGSNAASDTRVAQITLAVHASSGYIGYNDAHTWWLRDTGSGTSRFVYNDGEVVATSNTAFYKQSDLRGVRPAINIDLSKVLLLTPATGGKNSNGALTAIPSYTGNEWKLTVRDTAYKFAVAQTEATAQSGGTVSLDYTKAKYGANDYISAVLVNADGNALYYGKITQAASADGTVNITIPAGLAPGNYTLKVFNEQINGDYNTDKGSAFSDVALTVTRKPGDVNGDNRVDLNDVAVLTRYIAGGWNVTVDETVADVNKDGTLDLKDVVLIRRFLAGGWNVELQ